MVFADRAQAGRLLARRLESSAHWRDAVVLALPRGGVPAGFEIAKALHLRLDVFLVRKLGVPDQPELALGAIASGGILVLNEKVIESVRCSPQAIEEIAAREEEELRRREEDYRGVIPPAALTGRAIVLVDDGAATGSTMQAAIRAVRLTCPESITVALPVAAQAACHALAREVQQIVCLEQPERFEAVGEWYRNFDQVSDEQVRALLRRASRSFPPPP